MLNPFLTYALKVLRGWVRVTCKLPTPVRVLAYVDADNPALQFTGRPGGNYHFY